MPRYTMCSATFVVMVGLLPIRPAEAQVTGYGYPYHHAGHGSSTSGRIGDWWDGEVSAFKDRWHLPDWGSQKCPPPANRVQYVAPASSPSGIRKAVAPQPAEPANPATAGLVPGYPQFDSALYPTPRSDIPYQVGGTVITNQAFAPHEMLYPHSYKALYPPFYYKVAGGWMVTPWGVWSHDRWTLEGTEVEVKYKPHISFLSGFSPPVLR